MRDLLVIFWVYQEVFTRQNGYHSLNFNATQGKTQVGLISLTYSMWWWIMWCGLGWK